MANMAQAIRMALHYGEENLDVKHIFGEDVGAPLGGVMTKTQGLKTAWNSPLDERGIVGTAMGLAQTGMRSVAEIQFSDYIFNTFDLLKIAGNSCWSSRGQFPMPMVLMAITGGGIHGSIYHSHSIDGWVTRLAGWKIVQPSTPIDAYGLMLSAIEDPNPVMFLPPKSLLRVKGSEKIAGEPEDERELRKLIDKPIKGDATNWQPTWPDIEYTPIPLGEAKLLREGSDAVVISYGRHVLMAKNVADKLSKEGFGEVQVLDLRTLYPYDWAAISQAVRQSGRVLIVTEETEITQFGEHLLRRIVDEHFYSLTVRPRVLAGAHVPGIGLAQSLEKASIPQEIDVEKELKALLSEIA